MFVLPAGRGRAGQRRLSGMPAAAAQRSGGMIETVHAGGTNPTTNRIGIWSSISTGLRFGRMTRLAGDAIAGAAPGLPRVLGGISPIDPAFIRSLAVQGVLERLDVVAVHGLPLELEFVADRRLAGKARRDRRGDPAAGLGLRMRRFELWRGGGAGIRPAPHRRAIDRAGAADPLVQPLRSAAGLAGDHPPQGGGGLVLLSAFLDGAAVRGRGPETGSPGASRSSRPISASANGFISRITGSMMPRCG